MGNAPAARDAYQQSFEILQQLAAADPDNAEAQRSLSIAYEKIGGVSLQLGDTVAARDAYQRSLKIFERRAVADPTSVEAQTDLAYSLLQLGLAEKSANDFTAAAKSFQHAIAILAKLDQHQERLPASRFIRAG